MISNAQSKSSLPPKLKDSMNKTIESNDALPATEQNWDKN